MPPGTVEEAPLDERKECGHGHGRLGRQQLYFQDTAIRLQKDVRIVAA